MVGEEAPVVGGTTISLQDLLENHIPPLAFLDSATNPLAKDIPTTMLEIFT